MISLLTKIANQINLAFLERLTNYIGETTAIDKNRQYIIIVCRDLSHHLSSTKREPVLKVICNVGTSAMINATTKRKNQKQKKLGREKFVEVLPTRRCWLYIKQNLSSDFFS